MRIQCSHTFDEIISFENLLDAWSEFIKDKKEKPDVAEFQFCLMDNIADLHNELSTRKYKCGSYYAFKISDPKPRSIHKASVRDRLLHHAIHRKLYPFFDKTFVSDSYSCRIDKGTHKAINRFRKYSRQVSKNDAMTCWVLKCDIKKFFANIDHNILLSILAGYVPDLGIMWLLQEIITSFTTRPGAGLPLGNLTSQLFINVYMNEFDQFVKHKLKVKHYVRYADDFVFLSTDRAWLEYMLPLVQERLATELKLQLHPDKVFIKTLSSGVDFLGWVHFSNHRVLRTTTRKRMIKNMANNPNDKTLQSYLGLLSHGDTHYWRQYILTQFYEQLSEEEKTRRFAFD